MNLLENRIAVIGLGYVGLPLAALCARQGYSVVGFDMNARVVASLREGNCHFRDETVEASLAAALATGKLSVTTEVELIADCGIYLVCVPTPVDANNDPDLEPLESACRLVAGQLHKGDLVVVESTVFPVMSSSFTTLCIRCFTA